MAIGLRSPSCVRELNCALSLHQSRAAIQIPARSSCCAQVGKAATSQIVQLFDFQDVAIFLVFTARSGQRCQRPSSSSICSVTVFCSCQEVRGPNGLVAAIAAALFVDQFHDALNHLLRLIGFRVS